MTESELEKLWEAFKVRGKEETGQKVFVRLVDVKELVAAGKEAVQDLEEKDQFKANPEETCAKEG